ncbi:MAG: recombinase family protein, partial [Ruminiclostridium sp.]|nr:recombinase family protein [Ruminiclostridium sp.]
RLIDAFLNSVFLYEDSAVITFNYKFGSKTVSLADIHNYSDLTGFGEPGKKPIAKAIGFF